MIGRIQQLAEPSKAFQFASLARQGVAVLIAILLAKSPLSSVQIGWYEQLLYIGTLLTTFWVTGLVQALLAKYARMEMSKQSALLWTVYLIFLFLGVMLSVLAWTTQSFWVPILTGKDELHFLNLFLGYLAVQLPVFLLDNYYLLWEKGKTLLAYAFVSYGLQLPFFLLPIWIGLGLEGGLIGLLALAAIRHVWLLVALFHHSFPAWNTGIAKDWLVAGFPLVLYALVGVLSVSFDSWLVNWKYGGDAQVFAIFRYGAREFPLATALSAAFGAAMLPQLSAAREQGLTNLRKRSLRLFHLLFPLTIVLVLSSEWWFPKLFSSAFAASVPVFNIFMLITVSRLVFSRTVLVALDENKIVFYLSVLELTFNIVLGFILIEQLGILGVAWATVGAYTLEKIMLSIYLYRKYGIHPARYTPMVWLSVYSGLLLLSVFMV